MQTTVSQRFKVAVQNFMRSPHDSGVFSGKTRARVFVEDAEPDLSRLFAVDNAERIMRAEDRAAMREAQESETREDPQMRLLGPGFAELFRSVRERLPLRKGKKVLDLMNTSQLRESAVVIRSTAKKRADRSTEIHERRANYLEGLADAMSPYAQVRRGLTFREYRDLAAAGIAPERVRAGRAS